MGFAAAAEEDDDLVFPWQEDAEEEDPQCEEEVAEPPVEEEVEGFYEEQEEFEVEGEWEGEEVAEVREHAEEGEEEGLEWDGAEAELAAAAIEADMAFETSNAEYEQDGRPEKELMKSLRKDFEEVFGPTKKFELEAFGSYVTNLGLPSTESGAKSDLDVVILFHGKKADSVKTRDVRETVVSPTIDRIGVWAHRKQGIKVKNIIRKARVPIVTFSTNEVEVDVSVQQPWGVLNSWHLRDLCASGSPERLRVLVRLIKRWAKSKSIHTAKDGALSSYGYAMLAAGYLREWELLPALLPEGEPTDPGPYLDSDGALDLVLKAAASHSKGSARGTDTRRHCGHWREPELWGSNDVPEGLGDMSPTELFQGWLKWLSGTVMSFVSEGNSLPGGVGRVAAESRHIVSIRPRSQEELQRDITWSSKHKEHWSPQGGDVFLFIEEPLSGENVARCVRADGFWAIHAEVERGVKHFTTDTGAEVGPAAFQALLRLPPLSTREQPQNGVGLRNFQWGQSGVKRSVPAGGSSFEPTQKRFKGAAGQSVAKGKGVFSGSPGGCSGKGVVLRGCVAKGGGKARPTGAKAAASRPILRPLGVGVAKPRPNLSVMARPGVAVMARPGVGGCWRPGGMPQPTSMPRPTGGASLLATARNQGSSFVGGAAVRPTSQRGARMPAQFTRR